VLPFIGQHCAGGIHIGQHQGW